MNIQQTFTLLCVACYKAEPALDKGVKIKKAARPAMHKPPALAPPRITHKNYKILRRRDYVDRSRKTQGIQTEDVQELTDEKPSTKISKTAEFARRKNLKKERKKRRGKRIDDKLSGRKMRGSVLAPKPETIAELWEYKNRI